MFRRGHKLNVRVGKNRIFSYETVRGENGLGINVTMVSIWIGKSFIHFYTHE